MRTKPFCRRHSHVIGNGLIPQVTDDSQISKAKYDSSGQWHRVLAKVVRIQQPDSRYLIMTFADVCKKHMNVAVAQPSQQQEISGEGTPDGRIGSTSR